MTLLEAIDKRHSVRSYKVSSLTPEAVAVLREKVAEANEKGDLHIQLVLDEPKAFGSKLATYGMFSGVTNYLVVAAKADHEERAGYYGEMLVLTAQTLGINSCWVGLTYGKVPEAYTLEAGEKVLCVIALGYGENQGVERKHKSIQQVSNADEQSPEWFLAGVKAALKAPTAVNQQKFHFTIIPGQDEAKAQVEAAKSFSLAGYTSIDLGIVKCHFELAAGLENFTWK